MSFDAGNSARLWFDAVTDGVLIVDDDGVIRAANDAALRIVELDEKEVVGVPLAHIVPDMGVPENPSSHDEVRLHRAGGTDVVIRISVTTGRDNGGRAFDEAAASVVVLTDVTELVAARARLVEIAEQLRIAQIQNRTMLDHSALTLMMIDNELNMTSIDGGGLAKIGSRPLLDVKMSIREILAACGRPDHASLGYYVRALAGESVSFNDEWDGRSFEGFAGPVHGRDGAIEGAITVSDDVTERVLAQRALQESTMSRLLAQLPAMLVTVDLHLRITSCLGLDPALLGISCEEAVGMTVHEVARRLGREVDIAMWIRAIEGNDVLFQTEFGEHWFEGHAAPLRDDGGAIVGAVSITYDITERKISESERALLQQELFHSQKMELIGRFASGLAHDFNNMLTAIGGYNELVLQALPDESVARSDAEQIRGEVARAAALSRQLLGLSRREQPERRLIDLNRLIVQIRQLLRHLMSSNIEFIDELESAPLFVSADPSQLEQVVINLALNAGDAMPNGGRLLIATSRIEIDAAGRGASTQDSDQLAPGTYVRLVVHDTGEGMDHATAARIFEPFFTTKDPGRGTGLGLSTARTIIEASGGRISVDSEVGAGSTLTIYLPEAASANVTDEVSDEVDQPTGGYERVLLLDDDNVLRVLLARTMRGRGYDVVEAPSAAAALEIIDAGESAFDLVVSDVVMPGMSSTQFAGQLLERLPHTKVIFMSGVPGDSVLAELRRTTESAFLPKPFRTDDLLRLVREVLQR